MENKVCILMATYNGEKYVQEMLESLQNQSYKNFVCYIHDDGSTDSTCEILDHFCERNRNFIRLNSQARGGAKDNFLYLLNKFSGQYRYYMFCDQDDIWLPDKIKKSLDAIKKLENGNHSQPALIYCDMRVVDANLVEIAASFIRYNALIIDNIKLDRAIMKSYAAGCSIIINNALAQVAAIKDVSEIIMHDQWLMILAAGLGKIFYLDEPLVLYRQHEYNTLGAKRVTVFSRLFEIAYRCAFGKQFIITRRGLYTRIAQLARCADVNEFYSKYPELVRKAVDFENLSKIERCRYVIKYNLVQNNWSLIWTCICV